MLQIRNFPSVRTTDDTNCIAQLICFAISWEISNTMSCTYYTQAQSLT